MHRLALHDPAPVALAERADMEVGDVRISPSSRSLETNLGQVMLEPRVMQLLVALADSLGVVVSRETLAGKVWHGMLVGDDALNRAVAGARRGLRACGSRLEIITVPKIGYRLVDPAGAEAIGPGQPSLAETQTVPTAGPRDTWRPGRRGMLVAGAGAVVAGMFVVRGWRERTDALAVRDTAVRKLWTGNSKDLFEVRGMLERSLADSPRNAELWGLLAVARTQLAERAAPENAERARAEAIDASRRGLALDAREANSLAADAQRDPLFGAWSATDERLRAVAASGAETEALFHWQSRLAASMGRMGEALRLCEAVLALNPANAFALRWRSHGLWAAGRTAEAEAAALEAQAASGNPRLNLTYQWLLAHTGRPDEAAAAIRRELAGSPNPSRFLNSRLLSVQALKSGRADDLAAAETALLDMARMGEDQVYLSMLELGALGRLEPAFALARTWYFGSLGAPPTAGGRLWARYRRQTASLFLPPLAAMRADPRFIELMREIGMLRAWHNSAIRPDFLRGRLMPV